ncbi:MAG: AAA family ATPase [Bacteroidales bacterium]|nr:AAA family ATPase [Bacteroidales bacterium]
MRIYIVGYMGAGKTTVARRLAHCLGMDCFDTDHLFEERFKISTDGFFHKYDEPLYRKLESQILQSTERFDNAVISTGGGTACYNDNMDWMNQHGITVFLKVSPKTSYDRLLHAKVKRPLITDQSPEMLLEFIQQHYSERLPFYEKAMLTVKGEDVDVEALAAAVNELIPQVSVPKG